MMASCNHQASSVRRRKGHRNPFAIALVSLLLSKHRVHGFPTATSTNRRLFERRVTLLEEQNGHEDQESTTRTRNNRFASPLLEFGYPPAVEEYQQGRTSQKPLLLYIPGFDGTYLSAFFQYPELHSLFEVRCLVSAMDDRSTFEELKGEVVEFLRTETSYSTPVSTNSSSVVGTTSKAGDGLLGNLWKRKQEQQCKTKSRPVYLAGESFGGIVALEVAISLQKEDNINLQGLTLINAATCYDRSRLAAEGPPVAQLSPLLYPMGILRLLPMFLDDISAKQFLAIIKSEALPSLIDNEVREAYMGRLAFALPFLLKFMPQETFDWRLTEWLSVGCKRLQERLQTEQLTTRTLIIAGEKDLTLPSIAEAERLAQQLPNSQVQVVPQAGHANTAGTCLDLAAAMRGWFSELALDGGRTAMKPVAAQGEGVLYGMEPRYDGNSIGLNPFRYWSKEYYRKVEGHSPR